MFYKSTIIKIYDDLDDRLLIFKDISKENIL